MMIRMNDISTSYSIAPAKAEESCRGKEHNAMNLRCLIALLMFQSGFMYPLSVGHAEDTGESNLAGCAAGAKRMARLELIFGLTSKKSLVTRQAWTAFLAREVTPRFPDGFSVFDSQGQWRDRRGAIGKEPSRLLLIWYQPDATSEAKIEAIRAAYKQRFHQESVLRADEVSCVSF
jgi:hypothetical protein